MALAADTLRTLLKANLHNDQTYSDPGDLNTFLTLGQRQIVHDAPWVLGTKEGTLSVVASTRSYELAADFYQMRSMFYATNGIHLEPIMVNEFVELVERLPTIPSGAPRGYCVTGYDVTNAGWMVSFDYIPDASYTYKYWYYWMPADISGTATPPVSAIGFDELLLWAATMLARERNDPDGAVSASAFYERHLAEYKKFQVQGPDYAAVSRADFGVRAGGSTLKLPSTYPV